MKDLFEEYCENLRRKAVSSVSHDFKTPLACIIGSLEIIEHAKDKLTPEKMHILIQTALQEAHRLDALFSEVLDKEKT